MKIQIKKYTETLVTIAMLMSWVATMWVILMDPTNRMLWFGLAIISILFMLWHLSYMPAPQNPHLGGLNPKERKALVDAINS
jgi:hypothetical protein